MALYGLEMLFSQIQYALTVACCSCTRILLRMIVSSIYNKITARRVNEINLVISNKGKGFYENHYDSWIATSRFHNRVHVPKLRWNGSR